MFCAGCSSVRIPHYIHDKHPYKKTFYAPFDQVHATALAALKAHGWTIERESEPSLFERERAETYGRKQTLLFSEIRRTALFVGSRYARMNAYLREMGDKETEVEIRYVTVTSVLFKSFNNYRNDRAVQHVLQYIEEGLTHPDGG